MVKSGPAEDGSKPLRQIWSTPRTLSALSTTGADISLWMVAGRSSSPFSWFSLMLSKMLAWVTLVKVLNNTAFLATALPQWD